MPNVKAGFITGANAKITVFGKTIAYCTDVSYNVTVQTIPIESIGKYEVHSNEPVAYTVDGSFSIIRYTSRAKTNSITNTDEKGNAPSQIAGSAGGGEGGGGGGGAGGGGNMGEHINPAKLLQSQTFDLMIYEKTNGTPNAVYTVQDCRLTRRGMTLNKRGVMVDNYAFVGILAGDNETVDANKVGGSGDDDLK